MPVIGLSSIDGRVQAGACESWFEFLNISLTSGRNCTWRTQDWRQDGPQRI